MPTLTPAQVDKVSSWVADYIETQRHKYRPIAYFVPYIHTECLVPFFPEEVLATTSVLNLEEQLSNPPFYKDLVSFGLRDLPDFSQMTAVTFVDVVVSQEVFTPELLFHEFVHVVHYRQLGVERFARLYVEGFLKGGSYEKIPLERNAYALQSRFESSPNERFSVEDEVATWLQEGRS